MYKEFKTQMSYALLGMDAEKSITITNPPTSGKVSGSVTLSDMKYMMSTAEDKELLIRALYELRKITKESHEQYLKYNRQSNETYRRQLEIIDEALGKLNLK